MVIAKILLPIFGIYFSLKCQLFQYPSLSSSISLTNTHTLSPTPFYVTNHQSNDENPNKKTEKKLIIQQQQHIHSQTVIYIESKSKSMTIFHIFIAFQMSLYNRFSRVNRR